MLNRYHRLARERDFAQVYKKGRRVSGQLLRLIILARPQSQNRFGFVISKKDIAKASARNRAKRILRAAVRENQKSLAPGHDVIIQTRVAGKSPSPAELRAELANLLGKAKLHP